MAQADAVPCHIDASGPARDGRSLELLWKGWRHSDGSVWWDFVKVSDTLELCSHARDSRLSTWLRANLPALRAEWSLAGCEESAAFRFSQRAALAQKKRKQDEAFAAHEGHEVHVMSSKGLLLTLLYLGKFRKKVEHREMAHDCAVLLCTRMLDREVLGQRDWGRAPAAICSSCPESAHGAQCKHLADCGLELATACLPQARVLKYLQALSLAARHCPAVRAWWKHCVCDLSVSVDKNMEAMSYTSDPGAVRQPMVAPVLKHNHDEDLRVAVSRVVVAAGKATSSSSYVKNNPNVNCDPSTARKWEDKGSLAYQSANWKMGEILETISIGMDAGRFGNPAENTEVLAAAVACRGGSHYFVWLPPQAISWERQDLWALGLELPNANACRMSWAGMLQKLSS
jgi:hypothetical protein